MASEEADAGDAPTSSGRCGNPGGPAPPEPTIIAGIYAWLMGYRLLVKLVGVRGRLPLAWVGALSLVVPVLTALGEAAYFNLARGVDPARVVAANWSLALGLRPAAIVLALGLGVTTIGAPLITQAAKSISGKPLDAALPLPGIVIAAISVNAASRIVADRSARSVIRRV